MKSVKQAIHAETTDAFQDAHTISCQAQDSAAGPNRRCEFLVCRDQTHLCRDQTHLCSKRYTGHGPARCLRGVRLNRTWTACCARGAPHQRAEQREPRRAVPGARQAAPGWPRTRNAGPGRLHSAHSAGRPMRPAGMRAAQPPVKPQHGPGVQAAAGRRMQPARWAALALQACSLNPGVCQGLACYPRRFHPDHNALAAPGQSGGLTSTRMMLASTHQRGTAHARAVYRAWKPACTASTARGSRALPQQSTPRHQQCARRTAQLCRVCCLQASTCAPHVSASRKLPVGSFELSHMWHKRTEMWLTPGWGWLALSRSQGMMMALYVAAGPKSAQQLNFSR